MTAFFDEAAGLFETALAAQGAGEPADFGLLIDSGGCLHVVDSSQWSLQGMRAHYGAQRVYSVSRRGARVRVEGLSGTSVCLLDSGVPPAMTHSVPATRSWGRGAYPPALPPGGSCGTGAVPEPSPCETPDSSVLRQVRR